MGISVWLIYLCDHLLDSSAPITSTKYQIFVSNRKWIIALFILLAALDMFLIRNYLEINFIKPGVLIGLFLIAYFSVQHFTRGQTRRFFPKELIIITVYISAVWYLPVLRSGRLDNTATYLMVIHLLLVTQNVLIFSYFEKEEDRANEKLSIFTDLPGLQFRYILFIFNIAAFVLIAWQTIFINFSTHIFVLAFINLLYLLELSFIQNEKVKSNYPVLTDAAMLVFLLNFV